MFSLTGIYIDGSHMSSLEFASLVIKMAHDYGFELEWDQFVADMNWLFSDEVDVNSERHFDIIGALDWTFDDAIDYLNSTAPDNLVWTVEDNSLFLEELDASQ